MTSVENLPGQRRRATAAAAETTTLASSGLAIARALQASGFDSAEVFQIAGIAPGLSNDPLCRLPMSALTRLYQAAVAVSGNPYFGLLVAKHLHISNLHALGYALATSATLLDFCQRLARYVRLVSLAARFTITEETGRVCMRIEHAADYCGEAEDAFLGFMVLTMRMLYRPDFNPLRVELHRRMPAEGAAPYSEFMGAPVSFSHEHGLLVFAQADLLQPLDGSSPELAQVNDSIAISYLARLDKSDLLTSVKQKIIEMLPDGECSRDRVASALCMSASTLQLKLSQRGSHFQQLLDDTRKELACSYMQQPQHSITEIAFLLGFSTTGNFSRAFKRWTGSAPSSLRAK